MDAKLPILDISKRHETGLKQVIIVKSSQIKISLLKKYTFMSNTLERLKPSGLICPFIPEIEYDT